MKIAVLSEMRTGSTFVSEVLAHTLFNLSYHYLSEKEWMASEKVVLQSCQHRVVKIHHGDYGMTKSLLSNGLKLVVPVRDPLDIYHSAVYHFATARKYQLQQAILHLRQNLWVEKMNARMTSFIKANHNNIGLIPYERVIKLPFQTIGDCLNRLDIHYDKQKLKDACDKFRF